MRLPGGASGELQAGRIFRCGVPDNVHWSARDRYRRSADQPRLKIATEPALGDSLTCDRDGHIKPQPRERQHRGTRRHGR